MNMDHGPEFRKDLGVHPRKPENSEMYRNQLGEVFAACGRITLQDQMVRTYPRESLHCVRDRSSGKTID